MNDNDALLFFRKYFAVQCGSYQPFAWQEELFRRFVGGVIPPVIDLPTGSGKTSVMLVWYLAYVWLILQKLPLTLPRRLIWVVNRRVVVDQATDDAEALKALSQQFPEAAALAVSTLRGELADNGEWKTNPLRAAIVIGTVDMIGSRLLFSGYGDGPYWRAQHAGLLGVDALFINDEAHLTPAFSRLVRAIERNGPAHKIPGKLFRFCELSATHTGEQERARFPESLDKDLAANSEFERRFTGEKRLYLHNEPDRRKVETKVLALASDASVPRTIVFVRKPEEALSLAAKLVSFYPGGVELLTGTMRGLERDQLTQTDVFKALKAEEPPALAVCLIATSAGEVGVNITSERQITTLETADHLIQRFGRLNRFGGASGEAHLVFSMPSAKEAQETATVKWLTGLPNFGNGKDIRACTLREQPPPPTAITPLPQFAEYQHWLVELWSQTSGKVRGYPPVEPWLHGKVEDLPRTSIAWRWDVKYLGSADVTEKSREEVFRVYPVLAHERLTEPTSRIQEKLKNIAECAGDTKVVVQYRDGSLEIETVKAIAELEGRNLARLDEALVVLPPGIGRLEKGMFMAENIDNPDETIDVADYIVKGLRLRRRHREPGEEESDDFKVLLRIALSNDDDSESGESYVVYSAARDRKKLQARSEPYLLQDHLRQVGERARMFAGQLLPGLQQVYETAGKLHDVGKCSRVWQDAMGRCPGNVVAKSFRPAAPGQLGGYRHELGSLVEASRKGFEGEDRDLGLHLVASHHGHARPHFEDKADDNRWLRDSQTARNDTPARFGILAEKYGPWGLAYLEAIFKAADGLVSKEAEGTVQL